MGLGLLKNVWHSGRSTECIAFIGQTTCRFLFGQNAWTRTQCCNMDCIQRSTCPTWNKSRSVERMAKSGFLWEVHYDLFPFLQYAQASWSTMEMSRNKNVLFGCSSDGSLKIPCNFFEEMKALKVLDLTGLCIPSIPPSLQFLTNLQTLCLDWCVGRYYSCWTATKPWYS